MDADKKQSKKSDPIRRRLLIGLAGTPIMASLPSRSAWGQGHECTTISGMLSGNLSNHMHDCPPLGDGKTPDYWMTHPVNWPAVSGLDFGVMYKPRLTGNGGPQKVNKPCDECDMQGRVPSNINYTYVGGTTLNSLITQVLGTSGSTLMWQNDFGSPLMAYLFGSDPYARQVCAALLNALHSGVAYPYSPRDIAEALVTVNGVFMKETQLEGILSTFNANNVEQTGLRQQC